MTQKNDSKNGIIFDVVLGNPPFQNGSMKGGQNKIYNNFSKLGENLSARILAFTTPTSVLKKSKRFSLIGKQGLKYVDFTTNDDFNEGVSICSWQIDKDYNSQDVNVITSQNNDIQNSHTPIYNYTVIDKQFSKLYNSLKLATDKPHSRMFSHNAVDMTLGRGRSLTQTDIFRYPVHTFDNNLNISVVQYNKSKPKLHGKKQLVLPISKSLKEKLCLVSYSDFDMKYVSIEIKDDIEVENIKSFIFSNTFLKHIEKWKELDGYGWCYALMYLPKFDKNKFWTESDVKDFLESYLC